MNTAPLPHNDVRPQSPTARPPTAPKRLLLVDDEPGFTSLLKVALERTGHYEVETCNDSGIALQRAAEFRPDAIVLDLIMPGLDGSELHNELKKAPLLRGIPTIMVTALVSSVDVTEEGFTQVGDLMMMPKPISIDYLHETLSKLLDGRLGSMVGVN